MAQKFVVSSLVMGGILLLAGAGCETTPLPQISTDQAAVSSAEQTSPQEEKKQEEKSEVEKNDDKKTPDSSENESTEEKEKGENTTTPAASTTDSPNSAQIQGMKEITITAKSWEFGPNTITVNKGDKVRLKITSTDVTHGFALREYGINVTLTPGVTQTVEFVADKAGTFTFRCSVPCGEGHREMQGTLTVKE